MGSARPPPPPLLRGCEYPQQPSWYSFPCSKRSAETDGRVGRALTTGQPSTAPRTSRFPCPLRQPEGREAELIVRMPSPLLLDRLLPRVEKVSHEERCGPAIAEVAGRVRTSLAPEKPGWKGLKVDQLLERFTCFHERGAVESLALFDDRPLRRPPCRRFAAPTWSRI